MYHRVTYIFYIPIPMLHWSYTMHILTTHYIKWKKWCLNVHHFRHISILMQHNIFDILETLRSWVEFKINFFWFELTLAMLHAFVMTGRSVGQSWRGKVKRCLCIPLKMFPRVSQPDLALWDSSTYSTMLLTLLAFAQFVWVKMQKYNNVCVISRFDIVVSAGTRHISAV